MDNVARQRDEAGEPMDNGAEAKAAHDLVKDAVTKAAEDLAESRSKISTALDGGELERARHIAEEALRRWPRDYGLRIRRAEILQRLNDPAAAIEGYLELGRESAEGHWPLLRAVRLLRDSGDLAQAREVFAAEIWSGPAPEDAKLRGLGWLVPATDDNDDAAGFLERLAGAPEPALAAAALSKLAEFKARQGREEEARRVLARIGSIETAPLRARAVEADLMLAEGRAADLLPLARQLAAEEPDQIDHARRLVGALFLAGDPEEATEALTAALERWPGDWVLLSRFNVLAAPRERIEHVVDLATRRTDPAALPEISRFQIALSLLNLRRTEEALGLLNGIVPDGVTGAMSEPLRRILETMPAEVWDRYSRLGDDRAAEVQVVPCDGAQTAILVFGGATGGHSYLPFCYFDALFAGLPAHMIYLRDARMRGYLRGLKSFGGSLEGTVAGLRDLLADMKAERVVTLGASIGGHAAARIGAALSADAAVLLGAPTTFDTGPIQGERASPYNRMHRIRRWAKILASASPNADLVDLFAANPDTRNFYYFASGTARGDHNAARLIGVANVVLRPVPVLDQSALPLDIIGTAFWDQLLHEDLGLPG
ncbi:tetratricopeptide repeat protein [Hansschlegelia zhihuaiae]|uniref:Tetratricopeptide repeat protein n=1 Tax=Hansschlegelia zhihuaiae TaxID=405005 RepID=A0A4Q0MN52_9HYPH|nr:hypothetical protein [Hansschlegelia zhihuaiae]RXF74466.1 hypothetical protein EK403_06570 [Hansschlegelia zhihuaiae]